MKETELRIGNIVEIDGKQKAITVYGIVDVCKNLQSKYKPILITKEWLLKFGFKENTSFADFQLIINCFHIEFDISGELVDCYLESIGIEIFYVHQLQNLYFVLTGEELNSSHP